MPMDIEWAKDGVDGKLYIVQARPETVASLRSGAVLQTYALKGKAPALATGRAIGEKIASGRMRRIAGARDLKAFRDGEILVAEATTPDTAEILFFSSSRGCIDLPVEFSAIL